MSAQRFYLPYVIYQNLQKFFEYRKLDLVSGSSYPENKTSGKAEKNKAIFLEEDEFIKNIQYYGYILIETKDKSEKDRRFHKTVLPVNRKKPVKTFILLLDLSSTYIQSSQNFTKLLNRVPGFDDNEKDHNIDIIIISYSSLNIHLTKKIDASIKEGDENNGFVHIYSYKYSHFSSERPKHKLVPPHRILSKEEEREVLNSLFTEKKYLPKIKKDETISIWIGAEIGDVIEVLFPSEASGVEPKYLVVRP